MDDKYKMLLGDCIDTMKTLDADSVDSIVTDPPYGLEFMGKNWDGAVPGVPFWKEVLRVAKPGAYILAFGGTRTFHRLAVAIEDAGWEIRDTVMWVYGSGFPKSHNVAVSIDKSLGHPNRGKAIPTASTYQACDVDRENKLTSNPVGPYEAKSEKAKPWEGWGTALKPAWEPVIVARKPLIGTVAENVLKYGTGAMNIDGCRVGNETIRINTWDEGAKPFGGGAGTPYTGRESQGRWPANVIHDGSDEVVDLFPQVKTGVCPADGAGGYQGGLKRRNDAIAANGGDSGSAARFFYCSKANKKDRGENNLHPTVKPTDLMRYLCRLVTPPKGIVLDPFMGSGSTGKAAMLEGFRFIGCEMNKDYMDIAERRIKEAADSKGLGDLFDD